MRLGPNHNLTIAWLRYHRFGRGRFELCPTALRPLAGHVHLADRLRCAPPADAPRPASTLNGWCQPPPWPYATPRPVGPPRLPPVPSDDAPVPAPRVPGAAPLTPPFDHLGKLIDVLA